MTDATQPLFPVTPEDVDAALATFDGGLRRQNDERNARGYTTFYHPKDSMRTVLEEFSASRQAHSLPGDVGKPLAYMRRWAFEGEEGTPRNRPRGWKLHAVTRLKALDDDIPLHALIPSSCSGDVGGWIVGNSNGTKWRVWDALGPKWTTDRGRATRYARRVDAEQVHAEDEGAWRVEPYGAALTSSALSGDVGEGE